jgi:hypothetical protein
VAGSSPAVYISSSFPIPLLVSRTLEPSKYHEALILAYAWEQVVLVEGLKFARHCTKHQTDFFTLCLSPPSGKSSVDSTVEMAKLNLGGSAAHPRPCVGVSVGPQVGPGLPAGSEPRWFWSPVGRLLPCVCDFAR